MSPERVLDFALSEVPPCERAIDLELVEQLAGSGEPLQGAPLTEALAQHAEFLGSGGAGGVWNLLSVGGLPLCVYSGAEGHSGVQLCLRNRQIARGESLRGKDLSFADLSGSLCRGVGFQSSRLDGSVATDALFDGADFTGASLRAVDLSGSSLKGCLFARADLRGADLEHTDCSGADFTGAQLNGARFPGAILAEVRR